VYQRKTFFYFFPYSGNSLVNIGGIQVSFEGYNQQQLIKEPKVLELYKSIRDKYNPFFNQVEQVKKFELLPREWGIDTGEMTPKLSLKRKVVMEKFKDAVERIYD